MKNVREEKVPASFFVRNILPKWLSFFDVIYESWLKILQNFFLPRPLFVPFLFCCTAVQNSVHSKAVNAAAKLEHRVSF